MIFDWKNNKEEALVSGIFEEFTISFCRTYIVVKTVDKVIAHHTFRNFEKLAFEKGTVIEGCVFEDCDAITFGKCKIENCAFSRIDTIFSSQSNFTDCKFQELVCDNGEIIVLEDSEISHCSFENVELREGAYLCDGTSDSWIDHTAFSDVRTDREDREIIICEEKAGMIIKRKKRFCIVDEDTCTGLESFSI